jgi:hypothetical protein
LRQTEGTQFFMRQGGVFSRQMRGGGQFREKRAAMILRKIFRQFAIAR